MGAYIYKVASMIYQDISTYEQQSFRKLFCLLYLSIKALIKKTSYKIVCYMFILNIRHGYVVIYVLQQTSNLL